MPVVIIVIILTTRLPTLCYASPYLTSLDIYVWGHKEVMVYQAKLQTRDELLWRSTMDGPVSVRNHHESVRKAARPVLSELACA
jgi:hypothetical protein